MKTREQRKRVISIPDTFRPRFWEDSDGRSAVVKEIKRRVRMLRTDSGAEGYQKELLCERAVFLSLQLETAEISATEGGKFDAGVYVQASNALLGILRALGLEKKATQQTSLKAYVGRKGRA